MKNFLQDGKSLTITAPVGGFVSGQGYIMNALFGIASADAAEGESAELVTEGVFSLPAVSSEAVTAFTKAYWDDATKEVSNDPTGKKLIGYFTESKASGETENGVKLIPTLN